MKKDIKQINDQIDISKIYVDFQCLLPMKIESNIERKRHGQLRIEETTEEKQEKLSDSFHIIYDKLNTASIGTDNK